MKKMIAVATLAFLTLSSNASAETWNIDPAHSSITFEVTHMVISKVRGRFTDFSGAVNFDGKDISHGSVSVTAKTASVNTDNEDRDEHLRSDEFFDAEKYPTMTFKSTKVSDIKDGKFKLTGDLTIKDVTKEVTFDCEFRGVVNDLWGNIRAGFSAETTINRQDFNVSWSAVLEGGGLALGNDVDLKLEFEAIKAKPKAEGESAADSKAESK